MCCEVTGRRAPQKFESCRINASVCEQTCIICKQYHGQPPSKYKARQGARIGISFQ